MTHEIPSHVGRYRILELFGRWARGWIYRGHDDVIGRVVLVKTLCPPWSSEEMHRRRFQREGQVTSVMNHPNVITISEFGESNGELFMVFEALKGQSLLQLMNAGMSLKAGLAVMLQVLKGLACMHQRGVVHRDIKPASIFVSTSGFAKITDLSVAALINAGEPKASPAGFLFGTPCYMSPEHIQGEASDGRSDLFALGCMLYELVTREKPFGGEASSALIFRIVYEQPEMGLIPTGPEWERLRGVITRALQKKLDARYPTAEEMHADLQLALNELGPSADWTPPPSGSPALQLQ